MKPSLINRLGIFYMENNILKIITTALEIFREEYFYKVRVLIEPQKIAVFKKITLELYEIPKTGNTKVIVYTSSIERIANEEDKKLAINKVATNFLSLIFKYFNNETL